MKQTFRTVLGVALLIMAVIGGLLPILQGWIFFVAAVGVLGKDHWIMRWVFSWLRKIPWGAKALDKLNLDVKKPEDESSGSSNNPIS